jgi:hypothetical protein
VTAATVSSHLGRPPFRKHRRTVYRHDLLAFKRDVPVVPFTLMRSDPAVLPTAGIGALMAGSLFGS